MHKPHYQDYKPQKNAACEINRNLRNHRSGHCLPDDKVAAGQRTAACTAQAALHHHFTGDGATAGPDGLLVAAAVATGHDTELRVGKAAEVRAAVAASGLSTTPADANAELSAAAARIGFCTSARATPRPGRGPARTCQVVCRYVVPNGGQ